MILTKQFLNEEVADSTLNESLLKFNKQLESYDVFISYSLHDKKFAQKVAVLLKKCGYSVYIDYNDGKLNREKVDQNTALTLCANMKKCKCLLYLHSKSSSISKWCPWEVGYFSGVKNFMCSNLPIIENNGENFKHQEYLEIYPYIEYETYKNKDTYDFWVCESTNVYVSLRQWINGKKPYLHK